MVKCLVCHEIVIFKYKSKIHQLSYATYRNWLPYMPQSNTDKDNSSCNNNNKQEMKMLKLIDKTLGEEVRSYLCKE